MPDIELDEIDRRLLNLLQAEFPLVAEPYAGMGERLGCDGEEVIRRIRRLKAQGVIRQISPVLDARRLGYRSTLAAMGVPASRLETAARLIRQHPGVSHGYERDHRFNFWFTLAVPPETEIGAELERLTAPIGADAVFALPALKLFKIRAYFAMKDGQPPADEEPAAGGELPQRLELSPDDRLIINELQQELPLVSSPFAGMAQRLGMTVDSLLAGCRSLQQRGLMRRYGAAVNHRRAGFKANAMTCWAVPRQQVDAAGRELAALREVSHCYERATNALWPYNVFAMIHGHSQQDCRRVADDISRRTGLREYEMLFSTREFKKERIKYPV